MDEQIVQAVVWLVLWFVFAFGGAGAIYFIGVGAGFLLAEATDRVGLGFIGVFLGWLGGVAWFIFAAVQVVLQIISIVQLASG